MAAAIRAYGRDPSPETLDAASAAIDAYFLMINEDGDLLRDEVSAILSRLNMDGDLERDIDNETEAVISR